LNLKKTIAIIGEFHENSIPQLTLMDSINHVKKKFNLDIDFEWVDTVRAEKEGDSLFSKYSGFWSAPSSPFKSLTGVLDAIKFARVHDVPHIGTCAGFQHTILEFARNVLNIANAQHEEYDNSSSNLFISKLSCSLAGKSMNIEIVENSLTYNCYQSDKTEEDYYCNFGINQEHINKLNHEDLILSGIDQDGEVRIVEHSSNRFFVSTLFVPQTKSTISKTHPLIERFVLECTK